MRREFNLSGPVVNTLRLDSRRVRYRTHRAGVGEGVSGTNSGERCRSSGPRTGIGTVAVENVYVHDSL